MRSPLQALKYLAWQRKNILHTAQERVLLDKAIAELIAEDAVQSGERHRHLFARLGMTSTQ